MIVKKSVSIFVFGFFAYLLIVLPVFTHATTDLGMHSGHTGGVNIVSDDGILIVANGLSDSFTIFSNPTINVIITDAWYR